MREGSDVLYRLQGSEANASDSASFISRYQCRAVSAPGAVGRTSDGETLLTLEESQQLV